MEGYILQFTGSKLIDDAAKVFMLEIETFLFGHDQKEKLSVLVSCTIYSSIYLNK